MPDYPRLTSLSTGGGCACKLPSALLHEVVRGLKRAPSPDLLYGTGVGDDAAIFAVAPGLNLVLTADFFSPIVDDPYTFGQVAAANALSDVYAVGGRPLTALNLVGFPSKKLPLEVLEAILQGGADKCAEASCAVVGGHSIEDPEPKFGLAVTGIVESGKEILNSGARPGDAIVLTKPLGTGIVSNALKAGAVAPATLDEAVASMVKLNREAAEAMREAGATAATDITGFGFLAHLHNVLSASGVAAQVRGDDVPALAGTAELLQAGRVPGGTLRNLEASEVYTHFGRTPKERRLLLADAQTSGGLCVTLPAPNVGAFLARLRETGHRAAQIGTVEAGAAGRINVV